MMGLPSLHALDEYRLGAQRARIWRKGILNDHRLESRCWSIRLASQRGLTAVFLAPISAGREGQMATHCKPARYRSSSRRTMIGYASMTYSGMSKESAIRCVNQNSETSW